jgi:hypothetical protein
MTRIHTNAKPMDFTRGLQPMAREDEAFWRMRRERDRPFTPSILQRIFGRIA